MFAVGGRERGKLRETYTVTTEETTANCGWECRRVYWMKMLTEVKVGEDGRKMFVDGIKCRTRRTKVNVRAATSGHVRALQC